MMYLFWGGLSFLVAFYYRDQLKFLKIKIGHFCQDKGDFLKQDTFLRSAETFEDIGNTFSWSK